MQEEIPAAEAIEIGPIKYPGILLKGRSVSTNTQPQEQSHTLRIPTVFAPFYAGAVFPIQASNAPPGTTLHFANMTLFVANATYATLGESGVMDYFQLGTHARVCFSNRYFPPQLMLHRQYMLRLLLHFLAIVPDRVTLDSISCVRD